MQTQKFWSTDRFPVVYQNNESIALMVDMESFEKIEIILDNLINRDSEAEDIFFLSSDILNKLINDSKSLPLSKNWRLELDEL